MDEKYNNYKDINILRVSGSEYDIGYQHGLLLKDKIKSGVIPYFAKYVEKLLNDALGNNAGKFVAQGLNKTIGHKIYSYFPDYVKEQLNGLADGANFSRKELAEAVVMPETFLWLVSRTLKIEDHGKAPRFNVPLLGCSSVIASGNATYDSSLIHGRNLDYQGIGYWDTNTTVIFQKPKDSQSFVSIASAGVILAGITSMNEAGITLAVHQHLTSNAFAIGGLPLGVVGDQVMRKAENLKDAEKILKEHKPNGCWTYILSSGKEKSVLCYETTQARTSSFITDKDNFGYTNIFLDPELAETELFMYPSHWRSNTGRYHCIQERLKSNYGKIDEEKVANILGDKGKDNCRLRNPLAMMLTVGSVVFNPEKQLFYVGNGKAPTSNRDFIPFSLKTQNYVETISPLKPNKTEEEIKSFDLYCESYDYYFNKNNIDMARLKLSKAIKLQPKEALFYYIDALLSINDKDFDSAENSINKALEIGHNDIERISSFYLWKARIKDCQNQRTEAIENYKKALENSDNKIKRVALKGLDNKWKWKRNSIEFNYADVINP
ncbi:MAG: C45 family autoproteolytic acyltransferase/hydrolase [Candidatus Sericytochromatia bacterium]